MSDAEEDFVPGEEADEEIFSHRPSRSRGRAETGELSAPPSNAPTPSISESSVKPSLNASPALNGGSNKAVPRLKLKVAENGFTESAYAARRFDRDLDSDPEDPLLVEEQFILRLPEGSDICKKMHDLVSSRDLGTRKGAALNEGKEPWFKFRDSRRAVFGFGKPDKPSQSQLWRAKLVDLPCIVESHKTLDHAKHMYKVADINQMLVVEDQITTEKDAAAQDKEQGFNLEDYMWPHGMTPPLRHVRKRRFRRRANKRVGLR